MFELISLVWRICIGWPIRIITMIIGPPLFAIPIVGAPVGYLVASIGKTLFDPFH